MSASAELRVLIDLDADAFADVAAYYDQSAYMNGDEAIAKPITRAVDGAAFVKSVGSVHSRFASVPFPSPFAP